MIRRKADVVFRQLHDGLGLLRLATGEFYRLNTTGALIWEAMEGSPGRSELLTSVTRRLAGSPSDVAEQVDAFLIAMNELELIEVVPPGD